MNTPVVGVAVGLMFTYLIVSLVASAIKEVIASIFQWRGTYLQKGIEILLSTETNNGFAWGGWLKWLAAHVTWMDPTPPAAATATGLLTKPAADAATAAAKAAAAAKAVAAAKADAAAKSAAAAAVPGAAAAAANLAATDAADRAVAAGRVANDAATVARDACTAARKATAAATAADPAARTAAGDAATAAENAAARAVAAVAAAAPAASAAADAAATAAAAAATAAAKVKLSVSNVLTHPLLKGTPTKLPSYVPARDFATALLEMLRDGSASPAFSQVERTVAALPDGDIKRVLSAFIQDAAGDLDQLRARIETWFDDAMDRLSGIYKRFSQYFLLALGLVIAITLNVDSVHLATALWQQPDLRAKIAVEAQAAIAKPGQTSASSTSTTSDTCAPNADPASQLNLQQTLQQLECLPLPIGRMANTDWYGEPLPKPSASPPPGTTATPAASTTTPAASTATPEASTSGWKTWPGVRCLISIRPTSRWDWLAILGWAITAFAISLGAPFWFGLLQNIMNLRSSGPPPDRADGKPAANS
jgi:hypothetical protein